MGHGYIKSYTTFSVDDIAAVIFDVLVLFMGPLRKKHFFAEIGSYLRYGQDNNDNNDKQILCNNGISCYTAYGEEVIKPQLHETYEWKFKILKCNNIYIGIDQYPITWIDDDFCGQKGSVNYSFATNGNKYSHKTGGWGKTYQIGFKEGDIVKMKLDFSKQQGKLSFCVPNQFVNQSFCKAFGRISADNEYKMAVSLDGGSTIQLLDNAIADCIFIQSEILNPKLPPRTN